jgi:hypothetical protein
MPMLFWYLPFVIMSGAFDALYGQDELSMRRNGHSRKMDRSVI